MQSCIVISMTSKEAVPNNKKKEKSFCVVGNKLHIRNALIVLQYFIVLCDITNSFYIYVYTHIYIHMYTHITHATFSCCWVKKSYERCGGSTRNIEFLEAVSGSKR